MKALALLFLASCASYPISLDMGDQTVREQAQAWNDACGGRVFVDADRGSSRVYYVEDPEACAAGKRGEAAVGGSAWVFLCDADRGGVILHELGHMAGAGAYHSPKRGHHDEPGVMSDTQWTGVITEADKRVVCLGSGRCCK
jgi:hypothetical protein